MRTLFHRTLIVCLACLLGLDAVEQFDPAPAPLFIQADFPLCVRVNQGPLVRPRKPVLYPRNSETV